MSVWLIMKLLIDMLCWPLLIITGLRVFSSSLLERASSHLQILLCSQPCSVGPLPSTVTGCRKLSWPIFVLVIPLSLMDTICLRPIPPHATANFATIMLLSIHHIFVDCPNLLAVRRNFSLTWDFSPSKKLHYILAGSSSFDSHKVFACLAKLVTLYNIISLQ